MEADPGALDIGREPHHVLHGEQPVVGNRFFRLRGDLVAAWHRRLGVAADCVVVGNTSVSVNEPDPLLAPVVDDVAGPGESDVGRSVAALPEHSSLRGGHRQCAVVAELQDRT